MASWLSSPTKLPPEWRCAAFFALLGAAFLGAAFLAAFFFFIMAPPIMLKLS